MTADAELCVGRTVWLLTTIRINDQFRVCFRWEAGDAYEVEIADYH